MRHIKSPEPYARLLNDSKIVFLAGSIEMGIAEQWQDRLVRHFQDTAVCFLNPRRDDWDSSWVQEATNLQFNQQVTWELAGLEDSDLVVFYFDPNTKSPITLLELGLCARKKKLVVCCPDGFWKKGNVEMVCRRYGIVMVNTFEELVSEVSRLIK